MTLSNATPLIALDAIALDTETTGLDPAKARVVEIGAIKLAAGRLDRNDAFRRLVRPPEPVPAAAVAVHGIDDETLAGAPPFPEIAPDVARHLSGAILLGHSIGFDLAVLKQEFRRAGRDWQPPRALCTRLLAEVAKPDLPGYSLEQVAVWLGVVPEGRHSALGDAITAAHIFLALVPKLRERGIRTLAEAEHACRKLSRVVDEQVQAGWVSPVETPQVQPEKRVADLFPYRNRVHAVMNTPVFAGPEISVEQALARMMQAGISSLLVRETTEPPPRSGEVGIVTERDILRALAAGGTAALGRPIGPLASRPLKAVAADAFAYRAIARMTRLRIRHLGVTDGEDRVCGIVSARDLLRLRAQEAIWLGDEIDEAPDVAMLGRTWAKVPAAARALRREGVPGREVAALISEELRALTARAAHLAENGLRAEGKPPPCAYAIAVLGSAGRGESLLALDQDNALAFEDAGTDPWFAAFGQRLADILHEAGVPYCKGGVMASNPQWRGSLNTWRARVAAWIETSDPAKLLSVDIFFDLRGVYGDIALATTLRRDAFDQAGGQASFAKRLAESAGTVEPGLGMFGRFLTRDGRIDLKKTGLFGIVTARVLAIRHHVAEHSTEGRIKALRAKRIGDDRDLQMLHDAQGNLLELVLDQQLADIDHGLPPGNSVVVNRLSVDERDRLRFALDAVRHLDTLTRDLLF